MGALMFRGLFLPRSGAHSVSKAQVHPSARPDCYRHFLARYKTPLLAKVSSGGGCHCRPFHKQTPYGPRGGGGMAW